MSYSVPGPDRRDIFTSPSPTNPETSLVSQARQEAERLAARPHHRNKADKGMVASRPARPEEEAAAAGPPALQRLFDHEQARSAARSVNDIRLADRALSTVVGDLDELLDSAAAHLKQTGRGRSRQRVKDAIPQLAAISGLAALPLDDVADLLDLPRDAADPVLATLARRGGISPAERHEALARIEQLRAQLRQVEVSKNHSLLDRLLAFIVKIALLVGIAVAAAPMGAMMVGQPVMEEVIKAGIIALVTVALQHAAEGVRDWRRGRDPHTIAGEAHRALLDDLPNGH